ncbi:MAG: Hsp33 family molecular chaperone [Hyphomicrobiaceae bacterium]
MNSAGDQYWEEGQDDVVLPFRTLRSQVIGRVVRLGAAVDEILTGHGYPEPVSRILGEALVLAALLGSALKFEGKLILQARTDGPIDLLVADYETPGLLRGYASFDAEKVEATTAAATGPALPRLLGHGHLALTIDPGGDMDRYQGIVALDGTVLAEAAHTYFRQSEQLPTFLHLAVARQFKSGEGGGWSWRAGGIMIQHVPAVGGNPDIPGEHAPTPAADETAEHDDDEEDWRRTRLLTQTVQDHELLDSLLPAERLIYRLFHEEGVRAVPPRALKAQCRCSRQRIATVLKSFSPDELAAMRESNGALSVTCEFCSKQYRFEPDQLE